MPVHVPVPDRAHPSEGSAPCPVPTTTSSSSGPAPAAARSVHRLAPSGKRILLLERGDYVPREHENWSTRAVNVEGRYQTTEHWRDRQGKDLHPHTNYWVGGNTKFYGAALFRLRREDFGELRHHGGLSPAWPIRYEDLEPYYTEAEHLYQVHGERGVDPTEPPSSAPYLHPPVSHEPRIQQLSEDFTRLGCRPFHVPLGVMLDERNRRQSRCIRCATCDGHPCLVQAKSDAQVVCVDPALQHPNVTLLTGAYVSRLETSASGREVTRVVVEREGARETYSADIVVVSAGAINSAALLLRSVSDKHPRGLANGSDVVGRHYMGHINSVLMALSKCPNPTVFQKTLALNDFYFGAPEWAYPMGHISFVGKLDGATLSAGAPAVAPGWTLDLMGKHSLDFWLTSEDLPDPDNRVTLDRDGRIVLAYTPNNGEGHARLIKKLESLMQRQTACSDSRARLPPGAVRAESVPRTADPAGGGGPPERDHPLWSGPADVRAGRRVPGSRGGQSVRRGRKLLPLERRGESGPHHHGQRDAGGRPDPRPARRRSP